MTLLLAALQQYLDANAVGVAYVSPMDVELEPDALVQPDVFVVPPHESRRILREMPVRELMLAVEVLSPSSVRYDRVTKRSVYGRHVAEYWIVDLDARLCERWAYRATHPEVVISTLEWHPTASAAPFRLDLPQFFAAICHEGR